MAISAKSKILASDINTALSGKQDALGYIPVKSVNGVSADSAGNVSDVEFYPACSRFTNGIQFCWGTTSPDSTGNVSVTFDKAFVHPPVVMSCLKQVNDTSTNSSVYINDVWTAGFTAYKIRGNSGGSVVDNGSFMWLAFGHWK